MWEKLKNRWGVTNSWQVIMILVVFTVTGYSVTYIHGHINLFLGLGDETNFWLKFIVFMIIVMPVYIVMLYFWATILGQKAFFTKFLVAKWKMIKKLMNR